MRIHWDLGRRYGIPFEASPPVPLSLTGEGGRSTAGLADRRPPFSARPLRRRPPSPVRERGTGGEASRANRLAFTTTFFALLTLTSFPAHPAPLSLDVTAEHLSATFTGDRTTEASAVTLGIGFAPSERLAVRIEVPAVRARSSQTLLSRLGPTPRVLSALAAGNRALQRQVPGDWQTGLGDIRVEIAGELAGGGARLYRLAAELDAKVPTADADRRLGTGRWDARIGLLGERRFWSATLFGGAGFNHLGDPRQLELRDVPDGYLGIESEPWHEMRGAVWIEGHGAVVAEAETHSALGLGVRGSGRRPWRLIATVGLTGAEEEIAFLFGVSVTGENGWNRPMGRQRK